MIVVQLNTALQEYQFRHEKCVQDYLEYEAISGVILGEGGYIFMSMKLGMAATSFKGKQKGGGTWGITSYYTSNVEDHSLIRVWNG